MDDDKFSRALVIARRKEAVHEPGTDEEVTALNYLLSLYDGEVSAKASVKVATAKLDQMTLEHYGKLTTEDFQSLVIDDKWDATIASGVSTELDALTQQLVGRLHVLAERYDATVGDLETEVERLSAKVAAHLAAIGIR